jgi:hypothetical protein
LPNITTLKDRASLYGIWGTQAENNTNEFSFFDIISTDIG